MIRLNAARNLPPYETMRDLSEQIRWGHDADNLAGISSEHRRGIVLLPHHTNIPHNRALPAYLSWDGGTVHALRVDETTHIKWAVTDQGRTTRGTLALTLERGGTLTHTGSHPGAHEPRLFLPYGTSPRAAHKELKAKQQSAEWAFLAALEPAVNEALDYVNRIITREIEGQSPDDHSIDYYQDRSNHSVVDETTLSQISADLLYGDTERTDDPLVLRLIRRVATTSINNQPIASYLAVNLQSTAETAIRKHIGDPHVGRKVRRLVREYGGIEKIRAESDSIEDALRRVIELYRSAYPKDDLGRKRALHALTAGKTIDAVSSSLDQPTLRGAYNHPNGTGVAA